MNRKKIRLGIDFITALCIIAGINRCIGAFTTPAYAEVISVDAVNEMVYITPLEAELQKDGIETPFSAELLVPSEKNAESDATDEVVEDTVPDGLSDNEINIYTELRNAGLSKAGTAAVMGCMEMESRLRVTAENPNDGGYGLLQWTHERKTNLLNWCYSSGFDASSVSGQVRFFIHELESTYSQAAGYSYPVYETLTTSDSVEDCLAMFFSHMEAGVNVPISSGKVYCGNLTTLQLYNKRLNAAYKYF